jgi:hypothetical protein
MRMGGEAANMLDRELRGAVAAETDTRFLADITQGVSAVTASGQNAYSVRRDLGTALARITSQSTSRYYAIMQPAMAKSLATLNDASGSTAFPQMKPLAGELCDCTAPVSDGVLGGQMVVLDASQLVAAQGDVSLRTSAHGDIEMSDAPNSPPTAYNAHFAVADK